MRLAGLLAAIILCSLAFALPVASAEDCVAREYPPKVSGGVVGATWMLAVESANEACKPTTDAGTYGDLVCQWFIGLSCEETPGGLVGLVTWFLP